MSAALDGLVVLIIELAEAIESAEVLGSSHFFDQVEHVHADVDDELEELANQLEGEKTQ